MKDKTKNSHLGNQFVIIIAGVILITLLTNSFFQYNKEKKRLYNDLQHQGNLIGKLLTSISIEPLLVYDNQSINDFAINTTHQKNVIYTIFVDKNNNAITRYFDKENKEVKKISSDDPIQLFNQLKSNQKILNLSFPVKFKNETLAILKIGLDKKSIEVTPLDSLKNQIFTSLIFGLFIGISIYIGFLYKVSKPIEVLNKSAKDIINFNFDDNVLIPGNNELSDLANTFNLMRISLKEAVTTREKALKEISLLNESLEGRVKERTNKLEDLNSQITHQAMHDPLTGLPNRTLVIEHLNLAINSARLSNSQFAVFMLDLDNFKDINDTLGHPEGDIILKQVAKRIPSALRRSDTIGRLGGDEFAFVLPDINKKNAIKISNKIIDTLRPNFQLTTESVTIGASIGIAIYPEHGEDQASLIRHADVAMYESKRHSNSVTLYDSSFDRNTSWRLTLMGDLSKAIENNELELHYQPQVNLISNTLYGVEALLRWHHPEHGNIPPDEFIYLAESSGLINPLSDWVLNEALMQLKKWQLEKIEIEVSINISAKNLLEKNFADNLCSLINTHQVNPQQIKLELTESTIMSNSEIVLNLINHEKLKGIRYSIDDFGTGYSSLSYLKELPIDEVKIDKSFVFEMDKNVNDKCIVKSVIDLTHNLGHTVVAEGVENAEIITSLRQLGCDSIQGYFISKPMPADQVAEFIRKYNQQ